MLSLEGRATPSSRTTSISLVLATMYFTYCPHAAGLEALEQRVNVAASASGGAAWAIRNQEKQGLSIAGAIDGVIGVSGGWAFDGGLSDAFALFALALPCSPRTDESCGDRTRFHLPWIDEVDIYTAVGRHDHHTTMLRLWYTDALDSSALDLSDTTILQRLLRTPTHDSSLFRPLPLLVASTSAVGADEKEQASVVDNRILTGGGVEGEHITARIRPVQASMILLKVDATDSMLCDRRVSSSENEYAWHEGLVGAEHNTYQQHPFFLSRDDVCHNAIVSEFQVWAAAAGAGASAQEPGAAQVKSRSSESAPLLSESGMRAVGDRDVRWGTGAEAREGALGSASAARLADAGSSQGGAPPMAGNGANASSTDFCNLLSGEHEILFVGDSRMRAFFWHVLARLSNRPVVAHVNSRQWHVFGASGPAGGEQRGDDCADWQGASDVGWCWECQAARRSYPAVCPSLGATDLTGVLETAEASRGLAHASRAPIERIEAAAQGAASRARAARMLRLPVCEGSKTGPTALSFVHAPTVDSLLAVFGTLAAGDESSEGAGEGQERQDARRRRLVVWSPPLGEVLALNASSPAAPHLDVQALIQRLQAELPDAVRLLLPTHRPVLMSVEPFELAGRLVSCARHRAALFY